MPPENDPPTWDPSSLRQTWEALGAEMPLWAVLATDDALARGWDEGAFWATGRTQADVTLALLRDRGVSFDTGLALDFGCGVGRIAAPLTHRFERVVGLDAARSMLEVARTRNPEGRRVRYVHSPNAALPFRDDVFDFVFSHLVLQHCGVEAALSYVREFVRVLKPSAVATFSMPTRLGASTTRMWLGRPVATRIGVVSMDMAAIPHAEMIAFLATLPAVLELTFTNSDEHAIEYGAYVLRKAARGSQPGDRRLDSSTGS